MLEYIILCYGDILLRAVALAIAGTLGIVLGKIYKTHVNDDTKRAIARAAVACVQQVWYALDGPGKMQMALELMEAELKKKKIPFDADEMWILAEATIAEFKEAFKKPAEAEDTAKATYRVPEDSAIAANMDVDNESEACGFLT